MKFVCDNCHARYSIDDDRVRGRSLTIRCRKCSHLIKISAPAAPAAVTEPSAEFDDNWYYSINGESFGPMGHADLAAIFRSGQHGDEAHVWHPTFEGWIPISAEPSLRDALAEGARSKKRKAAPKTMRLDAQALLKESLQEMSQARSRQAVQTASSADSQPASKEPAPETARTYPSEAPAPATSSSASPAADAQRAERDIESKGVGRSAANAESDAVEADPLFAASRPHAGADDAPATPQASPTRPATSSGSQPAVPRLTLPRPSRPSAFDTRLPKPATPKAAGTRNLDKPPQATEPAPAVERAGTGPVETPTAQAAELSATETPTVEAPTMTPNTAPTLPTPTLPLGEASTRELPQAMAVRASVTADAPRSALESIAGDPGETKASLEVDLDSLLEDGGDEEPTAVPLPAPTEPGDDAVATPASVATPAPETETPVATLHLGTVPKEEPTESQVLPGATAAASAAHAKATDAPSTVDDVAATPEVVAAPQALAAAPTSSPSAPPSAVAVSPDVAVSKPAAAPIVEHAVSGAATTGSFPEGAAPAEEPTRRPLAIVLLAASVFLIGGAAMIWMLMPSESPEVPLAPVMVTTSPSGNDDEPEVEVAAGEAASVDSALVQAGLRRTDRVVATAVEQGRSAMALAASESSVARAQSRRNAASRQQHAPSAATRPSGGDGPGTPAAGSAPERIERVQPQLHAPSAGLHQGGLGQRAGGGPQIRQQMARSAAGPDAAFFRDSIGRFMPAAVQRCNRRHMQAEGEPLRERVEIEFHILPSGLVESITPRNRRIADTAFFRCLNLERGSWQIPAFEGESVRVSQPYVLN